MQIDLCAKEYSFGDARTALKHGDELSRAPCDVVTLVHLEQGDEACLHIWHLT